MSRSRRVFCPVAAVRFARHRPVELTGVTTALLAVAASSVVPFRR